MNWQITQFLILKIFCNCIVYCISGRGIIHFHYLYPSLNYLPAKQRYLSGKVDRENPRFYLLFAVRSKHIKALCLLQERISPSYLQVNVINSEVKTSVIFFSSLIYFHTRVSRTIFFCHYNLHLIAAHKSPAHTMKHNGSAMFWDYPKMSSAPKQGP